MTLPRDFEGDDPVEARLYLDLLKSWEDEHDRLASAQKDARAWLDAASQRAKTLAESEQQLGGHAGEAANHAAILATVDAAIASLTAELAEVEGVIVDHAAAHELATARLLGGPDAAVPLVLLPLRVQTHWEGRDLHVRWYPDAIGVEAFDPALSNAERAAGEQYWSADRGTEADAEQAWTQLVRAFGGPRAAHVLRATEPGGAGAPRRDDAWGTRATARLLPIASR